MTSVLALALLLAGTSYPRVVVVVHGQSVASGVNDGAKNTTPSDVCWMPPLLGGGQVYCGGTCSSVGEACSGGGCIGSPFPYAWPPQQLVEGLYTLTTTGTKQESIRFGICKGYNGPLYVVADSVGGYTYAQLKKGTTPWLQFEQQIEAYGAHVGPVERVWISNNQGESNFTDSEATYLAHLLEWQQDTEDKVHASTTYKGPVVMYLSQPGSWTNSIWGLTHSGVPDAMYAAAKDYPTRFKLVGPQYDLTYRDVHHPQTDSEELLGERIGRAGADPDWQPTWPLSVVRVGSVITVVFHTPVGPLVLDTTNVSDPGNYGLTYYCMAGGTSIASVSQASSDTLTVTLNNTPSVSCSSDEVLRYAYTSTVPSNPGPTTGPRGCIRDSDTSVGGYNWAPHFVEPVLTE